MKKTLLVPLLLLISITTFCQDTNYEDDDSTYIAEHLKANIEKFKKHINKFETPTGIEYLVDTFKIEEKFRLEIKRHSTDVAFKIAEQEKYDAYDNLLNKYYNKLLKALDKDEKSTLIDAQKAWISFQKKNLALTSLATSDKYFGKGSIQSIENTELDLDVIIARLYQIFNYYHHIKATNEIK